MKRPKMATKRKNTGSKKEKITVKAESKYLRISPRKLRLVVEAVGKMSPQEAINHLSVWNKKGARLLLKVIRSVLANAENNFGLKKETLKFEEIVVNEGPALKRFDRFHGARFYSGTRKKRSSHLKVVVSGIKES